MAHDRCHVLYVGEERRVLTYNCCDSTHAARTQSLERGLRERNLGPRLMPWRATTFIVGIPRDGRRDAPWDPSGAPV